MLASLEFADGGTRFLIFFATLLPAVWLASRQSSYLVDYFIVVTCLNRFVRRVLDWADGAFDHQPISSLLPLLIGCVMALVVVSRHHAFPAPTRRAGKFIFGALVYATAVGVGNGLAAFFTLLSYVTPFALLFYGIAIEASPKTVDRWIRTTTIAALLVAAYGWVQWAVVPPWDAAWVEWSGMWTSMGHPVPYEFRICSTLESRGPYGWFIAAAAVPLLALPRWRKTIGLPAAVFLAVSILPSTVRSSWAILVVAVVTFGLIRGGRSRGQLVVSFAVLFGLLLGVRQYLPESDHMYSRLESLADLPNDGSFRGRLGIATHGPAIVLSRPLGYGMGSSGMASRLTGANVVGDNGVIEVLSTFGIPGTILLVAGMGGLLRGVLRRFRETRSDLAALAIGQFAGGMAAMLFSNWLTIGYSGMSLMLMGGVLASQPVLRPAPTRHLAQPELGSPA